jgi:hypothetical protein
MADGIQVEAAPGVYTICYGGKGPWWPSDASRCFSLVRNLRSETRKESAHLALLASMLP